MTKITAAVREVNQGIDGTELFVHGYDPQTKDFVYSAPFQVEQTRALADATNREIKAYGSPKGLKGAELYADAETGELVNISTLRGILANKALVHQSKGQNRLPTVQEGLQLQRAGLYRTGVLIEHGLTLYNGENPDTEIAAALVADAQRLGLALPVLASFNSLDLRRGGERYGVIPKIVSKEGVISGEEAETTLDESFRLRGDSGVRWLLRYYDCWLAGWGGGLDGFDAYCRVGRFIAVGDAQKLEEEALSSFSPIRKSLDDLFSSVQ